MSKSIEAITEFKFIGFYVYKKGTLVICFSALNIMPNIKAKLI